MQPFLVQQVKQIVMHKNQDVIIIVQNAIQLLLHVLILQVLEHTLLNGVLRLVKLLYVEVNQMELFIVNSQLVHQLVKMDLNQLAVHLLLVEVERKHFA